MQVADILPTVEGGALASKELWKAEEKDHAYTTIAIISVALIVLASATIFVVTVKDGKKKMREYQAVPDTL